LAKTRFCAIQNKPENRFWLPTQNESRAACFVWLKIRRFFVKVKWIKIILCAEAVLYKKLNHHAVECSACAWRCKINVHKPAGAARAKISAGNYFLLVFGRVVAANVTRWRKNRFIIFCPAEKYFPSRRAVVIWRKFLPDFDISHSRSLGSGEAAVKTSPAKTDEWSPDDITEFCVSRHLPADRFYLQ